MKVYGKKYFPHDREARQDPKLKKMLSHFRKESEEKAKSAICVFWWIVEDMHNDDYEVSNLDAFADDYRCDIEFLKSILEDFDLFKIENGCYISERVQRNLREQEEKIERAKQLAKRRWGKSLPKKKISEPTSKPVVQSYDEKTVEKIIGIYNEKFNKKRTVSKENKERIYKINSENNLSLDVWEKIFSNAKRGWDIGDKKNVAPTLIKILDEWDSFASDDYFLAPDRDAIKREKAEKNAKRKEEELADAELAEQEHKKMLSEIKNIKTKEDAIKYVAQNSKLIAGTKLFIEPETKDRVYKKFKLSDKEIKDFINEEKA